MEHTTAPHRTHQQVIEGRVTSLSWIPSDAVTGWSRRLFSGRGPAHVDAPPPDRLGDLDRWRDEDRFRFANDLGVRVRVADGPDGPVVVSAEYTGRSRIGATTLRAGRGQVTVPAVALPELRRPPEVLGDRVRFVQTFGGRTGVPSPRRVDHAPWVQVRAPLVWTTLALTVHLDGRIDHEVLGASPFPRHWVYDGGGTLSHKVGVTDFRRWYHASDPGRSPWHDHDEPALVTGVESALERDLSGVVMGGGRACVRTLPAGADLVRQGERGDDVFLLLDGLLAVDVDGRTIAALGPGAVVGERSSLEHGVRTSTLTARTPCRVAAVPAAGLDRGDLAVLGTLHDRELSRSA